MIDEVAYRKYWKEMTELDKRAEELINTVKDCQNEFNWPTFNSLDKLCTYARFKGLLSSEERRIIRQYLSIHGEK